MARLLTALYSTLVYIFFFATFLYAIGFVENAVVPKTIDSGAAGGVALSILINAVLLGVFAVQHSVMARPAFKRAWTRIVPPAAERSTYVLLASAALALLFWQWRPLPQAVWTIAPGPLATAILAASLVGWAVVLASTFLINHFELFGLTQGWSGLLGLSSPQASFVTPLFYRWIRHPLYTGFLLAFWAAPHMSLGHLVFSIATTGYIFIGIWLEERDLVAHFGDRYRQYRATVGMVFPKLRSTAGQRQTR